MPSLDRPSTQRHGSYRLEIVRILLVQGLVLVAVSIAVLYYINWSSDAALAEFLGAVSNQSPQPPKLTQSVKSRKKCFSKT
jgi:hypothetical protein